MDYFYNVNGQPSSYQLSTVTGSYQGLPLGLNPAAFAVVSDYGRPFSKDVDLNDRNGMIPSNSSVVERHLVALPRARSFERADRRNHSESVFYRTDPKLYRGQDTTFKRARQPMYKHSIDFPVCNMQYGSQPGVNRMYSVRPSPRFTRAQDYSGASKQPLLLPWIQLRVHSPTS